MNKILGIALFLWIIVAGRQAYYGPASDSPEDRGWFAVGVVFQGLGLAILAAAVAFTSWTATKHAKDPAT